MRGRKVGEGKLFADLLSSACVNMTARTKNVQNKAKGHKGGGRRPPVGVRNEKTKKMVLSVSSQSKRHPQMPGDCKLVRQKVVKAEKELGVTVYEGNEYI